MAITAGVFRSGRSQALRWPAKLRLWAKEVRLEPIGQWGWVVQPELPPAPDLGLWLQQFDASTEPLPANFLADRQGAPRARAQLVLRGLADAAHS